MKYFDYAGIIHFHSEYSYDGRVPISEIIRSAEKAGVDILLLTDHECMTARRKGEEGWHGKTLLIVGEEIAPFRNNHFLVFGLSRSISETGFTDNYLQRMIDHVRNAGGIGLIAHPDHEGTKLFHVKQFSWERWDLSGYTGMSIWDFMTDWQSTLKSYWNGLIGFLFPAFVLRGPKPVTLKRWDALNQDKKIIGFGELDNHDTVKRILGIAFSVFPFRKAFRFVRTHILLKTPLTGDDRTDIPVVLEALREGHAYASLDYFAETKGFQFTISEGDQLGTMGDIFHVEGAALIDVHVPLAGLIRIIKNGSLLVQQLGRDLKIKVPEKGVYRVEIYIKKFGGYHPWIFSNPIDVQ
jgi:hypothetical protein